MTWRGSVDDYTLVMDAQTKADILAGRVTEKMTFTQKAWAMVVRVPAGRVTTYGDVAASLGSPRGARAVGAAMHVNPFAPAVPCHRVVGSDGKLTGFARGLDMKRALLGSEGLAVSDARVDLASGIRHHFS